MIGRGEVGAGGWLVDRNGFEVQAVTWVPDGRPIALFALDLPSDVRVTRDTPLREVNTPIERYRLDLVVGDYKAPCRHVCYRRGGLSGDSGHRYQVFDFCLRTN